MAYPPHGYFPAQHMHPGMMIPGMHGMPHHMPHGMPPGMPPGMPHHMLPPPPFNLPGVADAASAQQQHKRPAPRRYQTPVGPVVPPPENTSSAAMDLSPDDCFGGEPGPGLALQSTHLVLSSGPLDTPKRETRDHHGDNSGNGSRPTTGNPSSRPMSVSQRKTRPKNLPVKPDDAIRTGSPCRSTSRLRPSRGSGATPTPSSSSTLEGFPDVDPDVQDFSTVIHRKPTQDSTRRLPSEWLQRGPDGRPTIYARSQAVFGPAPGAGPMPDDKASGYLTVPASAYSSRPASPASSARHETIGKGKRTKKFKNGGGSNASLSAASFSHIIKSPVLAGPSDGRPSRSQLVNPKAS